MRNGVRRTRLRVGVAGGIVAALVAGTVATAPVAMAAPDDETIWEEGTVTSIADGDTLVASLDAGSGARGSNRIRTIGVQAPEVAHNGTAAECGASQATARLKAQLPVGSRLQTRSVDVASYDDYSGGRIVRSLYAQDEEGNWYDTSRGTVSDGWLMWFPLAADSAKKAEWAHNLEYRVLADDAASQGRGLWSANLCGGAPYAGANLRVWAKYWGTEQVYVENLNGYDVDLSGWTIRDSAISGFARLPAGTIVPAGQARQIFSGDLKLNNLPADNAAFEGDAVYLMDNAGSLSTGNLRGWFAYPCNPDACDDPLSGTITMSPQALDSPSKRKPSDPGSVAATATTDGTGTVTVTWAAPSDLGGPSVTYTVTAVPASGSVSPQPTISGTSATFTGLPLGVGYRFDVTAVQPGVGSSGTVRSASPVAAAGLPGAPTAVTAEARPSAAVVRWTPPAQKGGFTRLTYTASAVEDPTKTCAVTDGSTSCLVGGLSNDVPYTFTVVASNGVGPSAASTPSVAVTPTAASTGPDPVPNPVNETAVTERTSPATAAPPAANPWIGGQYVDVTNTSGSVARLGGYGLWDAQSSRFVNGSSTENRAAYVFDANLTLAPSETMRVYFIDGTAPTVTASSYSKLVFAGSSLSLEADSDFVEMSNLNGAQIACRSKSGATCARAKTVSVPSSPVGVTARTSDASVAVTWGAPISRGGQAISSYTATAYDAPAGGTALASCTADGNGRTCSFAAALGRTYYVDVVATNATGTSGPSWRVRAVPKTVPSAPANVSVSGTPGGINVSWSPAVENGAAITKYTASAYKAGTGGSAVGSCSTSNGSLTSCTILGLTDGTYYVDVKATNRAGTGAASSPRTAGKADAGRAVSTYSKGKVTVRWDAPSNSAGIAGYSAKLYTKASGGSLTGSCSAGATATSCTTKKMKKRSKYYIALTVASSSGSYTVKPRIVTGPAKKAKAPKVTSATPSGKRVVIAWNQPTFNGYSYLKSYGARLYSKSKGGKVKASCSVSASSQTCTTKAVKKGTYYAAARVKNSKGWSSWSKRVKVKVK